MNKMPSRLQQTGGLLIPLNFLKNLRKSLIADLHAVVKVDAGVLTGDPVQLLRKQVDLIELCGEPFLLCPQRLAVGLRSRLHPGRERIELHPAAFLQFLNIVCPNGLNG